MHIAGYLNSIARDLGLSLEAMKIRHREIVLAGMRESARGRGEKIPTLPEHLLSVMAGISDATVKNVAADVSDWTSTPLRGSDPKAPIQFVSTFGDALEDAVEFVTDHPTEDVTVEFDQSARSVVIFGEGWCLYFEYHGIKPLPAIRRKVEIPPAMMRSLASFNREVIRPAAAD